MNRIYNRFGRILLLVFLSALSRTSSVAQSTNFTVLVMDAKSGKPVADNHVLLFGGRTEEDVRFHRIAREAKTNENGLASFDIDPSEARLIQIYVDWHVPCQRDQIFSLPDILSKGLQSLNKCNTRRFGIEPGQLTVLVRSMSFVEKMKI
jgi:hypothetical protein